MVEYIIYADLHLGSPYEIMEEIIPSKNTVLLGDNFEMKNILKREFERIKNLRENTMKKIQGIGGVFLDGNHELKNLNKENSFVKRGKVIFIHGDIIEWKTKTVNRKRNGKIVPKFFWYVIKYYKKLLNFESQVTEKHLERARVFAKKNGGNIIVMGHFHPKNLVDKVWNGVRIIVVPRGKTILNL